MVGKCIVAATFGCLVFSQLGQAAGDPATYLDDGNTVKEHIASALAAQEALIHARITAASETQFFAMVQGIYAQGAITAAAFQAEQLRYAWTQALPGQAAATYAAAQASVDAQRGKRDHRWLGAPNLDDLNKLYQSKWQADCNVAAASVAVEQAEVAWRNADAAINEDLYAHQAISERENIVTEIAAQTAAAALDGALQLQAHCKDEIPNPTP